MTADPVSTWREPHVCGQRNEHRRIKPHITRDSRLSGGLLYSDHSVSCNIFPCVHQKNHTDPTRKAIKNKISDRFVSSIRFRNDGRKRRGGRTPRSNGQVVAYPRNRRKHRLTITEKNSLVTNCTHCGCVCVC